MSAFATPLLMLVLALNAERGGDGTEIRPKTDMPSEWDGQSKPEQGDTARETDQAPSNSPQNPPPVYEETQAPGADGKR